MLSIRGLVFTVFGFLLSGQLQQYASGECNGLTTYMFLTSLQNGTISVDGIPHGSCKWLIIAPPGQRVLIYFSWFQLEDCFSCSCDAVTMFEGPRLATYCGRALPPPVFSPGNEMLIAFRYHPWGSFGGFKLNYTTLFSSQGCPSIDPTASTGVIYSPNFPWYYPNNKSCDWFITVPYGRKVNINFTYVNFHSSHYCNDYVDMYEMGNLQTKKYWLCGDLKPLSYSFTFSSSTHVRYNADPESTSAGFMAFYKTSSTNTPYTSPPWYPTTQSDRCQPYSSKSIFVAQYSSSQVKMGYLFKYVEPYTTCTLQIDTTHAFVLELTFNEMSITSCSTCSCGHVQVRDGSSSDAPLLGIFCNTNYNERSPVSTTGNHMRIEYYAYSESDYFQATVQSKRSVTGIFVPAIAVPIAIGVVLFVTIAIVIKCVKMKRRRSTGQDYNTEYPLLIEPEDDDEMINLAGDDNPAATATA